MSFYLNVDGSRFPRHADLQEQAEATLRLIWQRKPSYLNLDKTAEKAIKADINRISDFVNFELERNKAKSVVIFSCLAKGLWEVFYLPVSLPSTAYLAREPYTKILTAAIDQFKRFCVLVVDRRSTQLFTVYLEQIEEHCGLFEDDVPAKVREGQWAGLRETKITHHIEDHLMRHLKLAANKAFLFFKQQKFDFLIVGGPKETLSKLKIFLHPSLKEKLVGEFLAQPQMPLDAILAKSLRVEAEVNKKSETRLVKEIIEENHTGGKAVSGLEPVLEAINNNQVRLLLIANGYVASGNYCSDCHYLSVHSGNCPTCQKSVMLAVDDVVGEAVEQLVRRDVTVRHIQHHQDFIKRVKIAALLRFPRYV